MILENLDNGAKNRILNETEEAGVPVEGSRVGSVWLKGPGVSVHLIPQASEDHALIKVPEPSQVVAYKPTGIKNTTQERVFIVADQQIGWWCVRDSHDAQNLRFEAMHDEQAQDIMLQAMSLFRPDTVVIIGDFVDYPQLSKFTSEPEFAQTMQASINTAEQLIAKIRATVGKQCKMVFIPGNHETRMQRAIVNNIPALYNLTRPGETWPLYSIPSLLRFEHHNVECMAEYPSGQYWIASRRGNIPGLVATHGDPAKKDMRADSIHGHLVLPGIETFAREYEDGWVTYTRMCVSGCANYSDTGDKVRVTRTITPSGRSRMASVQSFGTVQIDRETGQRDYQLHLIRNSATSFFGRIITSSLTRNE
jgi:hypothetical protein